MKNSPSSSCLPSPISTQSSPVTSTLSSMNGSRSGGGSSRIAGTHQRQPVIIYTHSPKVIHTRPQDFMALVQKLTGFCRSEENHADEQPPMLKLETSDDPNDVNKNVNVFSNNFGGTTNSYETDSSSVITEDINSLNVADSQVINSSFIQLPIYEGHLNSYMTSFPMFNPNSTSEILRPNQSSFFNNYSDRLYFGPDIQSTFSSTSTMEMMMNEFSDC